jgi:hypothetical protein
MIDGEWEYEVKAILSHRFLRGNNLEFLVRWLGYGHEHDTWEPEENCANSADLVTEYWARVKMQADKKPVSKRKQRKRSREQAASSGPRALRTSPRKRRR